MTEQAGVFLIGEGGELTGLQESPYEQEEVLQTFLARYPEILSGCPRRLILVRREAPVRHGESGSTGWLDHLFLDDLGVPTLVEVKRSTDARIRREVVGQMLDYAANAAFDWPIERLRTFFEETCSHGGRQPDEALADFLEEDGNVKTFWELVKTNLQAGKVRLLFVADRIPSDLRRIIEFLNTQMDPCEVLGVEIRHFARGNVRTLIPKVVGQTAEAERRKGGTREDVNWDGDSFFARLEATAERSHIEVARKLLDWAKRNSKYVWWGKGKTQGSFGPSIWIENVKHNPFAVYSGYKGDPVVEIYFQWLAGKTPFDSEQKREELRVSLNRIEGVDLPPDCLSRRPSVRLASLAEGDRVEQFLGVFDWLLDEIRRTSIDRVVESERQTPA